MRSWRVINKATQRAPATVSRIWAMAIEICNAAANAASAMKAARSRRLAVVTPLSDMTSTQQIVRRRCWHEPMGRNFAPMSRH